MRKNIITYLWSIIILLALYDLSAVCILRSCYIIGAWMALMFFVVAYISLFLTMTKTLIMLFER